MVDQFIMLKGQLKYPKLKPSNLLDGDSMATIPSPGKNQIIDDELKVYDGSKTESTLRTDSSMRDYDYMNEPELY